MLLVACLSATDFVAAQITLDTSFESGSLDLTNSIVIGDQIRLRGDPTWSARPENFRWVYFRATGVENVMPTFEIGSPDNRFLGSLAGHHFSYSYDGDKWSPFDSAQTVGFTHSFQNQTPFEQDTVYVAYGVPYSYTRAASKMEQWLDNRLVQPSDSANFNGAIGTIQNSTAYATSDLSLFGIRIHDSASAYPFSTDKQSVVLLAGNHSGEMAGNWVLEGLVDFVLGDHPDADWLRRNADLHVYPMLDPLGRVEGHFRGNSQNPMADHNRYWDAADTGDDGGFREIGLIDSAVKNDTGGKIDYLLDFHGFFDDESPYIYSDSNGVDTTFLESLRQLEPEIRVAEDNRSAPPGILEFWARRPDGLNAERSYTPEFPPSWPAEDYLAIGESYGLALADALASHAGDFDKNHVVDAADIGLLYANLGSNSRFFDLDADGAVTVDDLHTLVTDCLASRFGDANLDGRVDELDFEQLSAHLFQPGNWASGDFNGDGTVDGTDFNLWIENSPTFAESVPEPTSWWIVVGLLWLPRRREIVRW